MSMLSRSLTIAATATLGAVPLACAHVAPAPSPVVSPFVGQWELNVAKSDFGAAAAQAPSKATLTITRSGDVLTLAQAVTMGGQAVNMSTAYAFTGRDTTTNAPDGLPFTSSSRMTDSSATITSKLQRQGMDLTITSRWSLSDDRKVMTIAQETAMPMGAVKMTMVYDRKE